MDNDYSAYLAAEADEPLASLGELNDLAERQAKAEARVAKIEAELAAAQADLKDIAEKLLPDAMDALGIADFKTRSGLKITIDETIRASIPKARTLEAYAWLRAHNHEALIKRVVALAFGKGEDAKARETMQMLAEKGLKPQDVESVHAQTLGAFVREKLKKGDELPLDLFGVHRQRASKIEVPK